MAYSITVTWSDLSSDETGFRIYRALESSSFDDAELIAEVDAGEESYLDEDVKPGYTYYYWVTAYNSTGESDAVGPIRIDTVLLAPILTLESVSTGSVVISWTDENDIETAYKVWRAFGPGAFALKDTLDPGDTEFTDSTVSASSEYTYKIEAYNSDLGYGVMSEGLTVKTVVPAESGGGDHPSPYWY